MPIDSAGGAECSCLILHYLWADHHRNPMPGIARASYDTYAIYDIVKPSRRSYNASVVGPVQLKRERWGALHE